MHYYNNIYALLSKNLSISFFNYVNNYDNYINDYDKYDNNYDNYDNDYDKYDNKYDNNYDNNYVCTSEDFPGARSASRKITNETRKGEAFSRLLSCI